MNSPCRCVMNISFELSVIIAGCFVTGLFHCKLKKCDQKYHFLPFTAMCY